MVAVMAGDGEDLEAATEPTDPSTWQACPKKS